MRRKESQRRRRGDREKNSWGKRERETEKN